MPINTQVITRHNALGNGTGFGLGKDGDPAYTIQAGHEHGVVVMSSGQANAEILSERRTSLTGLHEQPIVVLNDQGGSQMSVTENVSAKLRSQEHGHQPIVMAYENHPNDSRITETGDISQQLTSRMGTGGGNVPLVQAIGHSGGETLKFNEKVNTLNAQSGSETTAMFNGVMASGVRRLTPTECERLQGFPDGWTDGQADSHRYKQMGNAVTVNVAEWIGKRIKQSEIQEQTCTKN
jgi:DNA (cytosine-5)-methyltransferase 1